MGKADPDVLIDLDVPFKENLYDVFYAVTTEGIVPKEKRSDYLKALCRHTGDVLKCIDHCLRRRHYHFKTSEKRLFVKLLESYDVKDLGANLILSKKTGERVKLLIQFLDYGVYSRSDCHKEMVVSLKSGKLRSWNSRVEYLLSAKDEGALAFIAKRPGMLLRMLARLLRSGYPEDALTEALANGAESLSTQTIVNVLTYMSTKRPLSGIEKEKFDDPEKRNAEKEAVVRILETVLRLKLAEAETPLAGKKVFVDPGNFDLSRSQIIFNGESESAGFIPAGFAYSIPKEANAVRFFVYWNDKTRVDLDLHATAYDDSGQRIHVGWNGDYNREMITMSGDITHSDAAEYIDVRTGTKLEQVNLMIHLFAGRPSFKEIDETLIGLMVVKELGEDVKLYDPKNCLFSNRLDSEGRYLQYGVIDTKNRVVRYIGKASEQGTASDGEFYYSDFTVEKYVKMLLDCQQAGLVETADEADIILTVGKNEFENGLCLVEENYFI